MDWVSELDEWDLAINGTWVSLMQMNDKVSVDDVLPFMIKGGPTPPTMSAEEDLVEKAKKYLENDPRPPIKYWHAVCSEIIELVCGNTKKYKELKSKISASIKAGENALVALIAANVALVLGVEAAVISSFCALFLFSIRKVGVNAYCKTKNINVK